MNRALAQIIATIMPLSSDYTRMMENCEHPNIVEDGKLKFWSISKQRYITSACQPKERTK